ncbi:MAG: hypothetical protein RIN56_18615 [Sporomusaceae bacterium]|nr:hypothetical protein [Sporomusaceae bacterium]
MPWCPSCREEYRQGFETCIDCGAELVDELPPPGKTIAAAKTEAVCDTFLTTAADWQEAGVLEAFLKAAGIAVMKDGSDFYVPLRRLEDAQAIVDSIRGGAGDLIEQEGPAKGAVEYRPQNRKNRRPIPQGDSHTLWCPRCGTEYRQGFRLCGDCGAKLVDSPEEIVDEDDPPAEGGDEISSFCDAYLATVADSAAAETALSALNEDGIPAVKAKSGSGVDIYVPEEWLDAARDVVASLRGITAYAKQHDE